jgi:NAD(P)-dependent dehydrogenase (short-subunit alcohol dehydrogenase family)
VVGSLQDQVALITGAGRGLGQAVAVAYAREGAQVIAASRTAGELARTKDLAEAEGGRCETLLADVSQEQAMRDLAGHVLSGYGRLDVLVNNAGVLPLKTFEELTVAEWDNAIAVNLRGPMLGCKFFLEAMKQQGGGSIINVSSGAGVKPFERESVYCASKFALEGFTRTLALELKRYNIASNTITPGSLPGGGAIKPTSITQAEFDALSEEQRARWRDPMILTEAFIFLARQRGDGVTGRRISAAELSEQIRRVGYDSPDLLEACGNSA